jgi:hypothetical protein
VFGYLGYDTVRWLVTDACADSEEAHADFFSDMGGGRVN